MPYKDPIKRREEHTRYMREVWYPANKEKHKRLTRLNEKKRRDILYKWINGLKTKQGCVDCGIKDFRVLDFDHLPKYKKINSISRMVSEGAKILVVEVEIQKCAIRCANCHRLKTIERRAG